MKKLLRVSLLMLLMALFVHPAFAIGEGEPNDWFNTATSVRLDQFVVGRLYAGTQGADDDDDFFKFTVDQTGNLEIHVNCDAGSPNRNNVFLELYMQASSNEIFRDPIPPYRLENLSSYDDYYYFKLEPGTYYLRLFTDSGLYKDYDFDFEFSPYTTQFTDSKNNDSLANALPIELNSKVTAFLGFKDIDVYRFSVTEASRLELDLIYLSCLNDAGDSICVFDAAGNELPLTTDSKISRFIDLKPGTYYLAFINYSGDYDSGSFWLRIDNPPAPVNFSLSSTSNNSIKISWDAVEDVYYELERSTSPSTGFETVAVLLPGTLEYTDTELSANQTYYYRLRAFRMAGADWQYGPYTEVKSATAPEAADKPNKPEDSETPSAPGFTDVASGAFYEKPVAWAVEKGITTGRTATTFAPDDFCKRSEVVTFLHRAQGKPVPGSTQTGFTDVEQRVFYTDAVAWALENSITNGMGDGTFGVNRSCTRAQVVTFLWRAAGEPSPSSIVHPFTDLEEGAFYYDAVLWAVEKGITNGMTATTFAPNGTCTRGQIVTFLYRALG